MGTPGSVSGLGKRIGRKADSAPQSDSTAAFIELDQRGGAVEASDAGDAERDRLLDQIADLEDRLDQLQRQDWAAYGQALQANVQAAAARRWPNLPVAVVVTVDLTPGHHTDAGGPVGWGIADQLLADAVEATAPPGGGQLPLQRLHTDTGQPGADADAGDSSGDPR